MVKKNKVKPTNKQRRAFENIESGMSKRQAMISAGFTEKVARSPRQNLLERRGYQELIEDYRHHLRIAGIGEEVLAEVQAEGLFDQDARVRLEYLKENKKDFGLYNQESNIQINNIIAVKKNEYSI